MWDGDTIAPKTAPKTATDGAAANDNLSSQQQQRRDMLAGLRQSIDQLEAKSSGLIKPPEDILAPKQLPTRPTHDDIGEPNWPQNLLAAGRCHGMAAQDGRHYGATTRLALEMLSNDDTRPILWVTPRAEIAEFGQLYAPGLRQAGLDPSRIVQAITKSRGDALWAMEMGLRSGALAAVVGELSDLSLAEGRRLALLADNSLCLFLYPRPHAAGAVASHSTVQASVSYPHPQVAHLPGQARISQQIRKLRGLASAPPLYMLEENHATHRLAISAPLVKRPVASQKTAADRHAQQPA